MEEGGGLCRITGTKTFVILKPERKLNGETKKVLRLVYIV